REATFAHVDGVSLGATGVQANAIAGDTNQESARDLANGTDYSDPGPYFDQVSGYFKDDGAPPGAPQCNEPPPPGSDQPPQHHCATSPYLSGRALPYQPA